MQRRRDVMLWRMTALASVLVLCVGAAAARPAKQLFADMAEPSAGAPAVHGGAARGCLAGARALPLSGPGWQVLRPQRNRYWAHPETLAFVERLGAVALDLGWPALLVGDLSQPRGGPMAYGHASHQSGIDADIWLRRPSRLWRDDELAEPVAISMVAPSRRAVSADWTAGHAALLRAAASDPAVDRIFINAAIKAELCRLAPAGDRAWLRRLRPWWGHDSHFHVRLACPAGETGCVAQAPVPPGDGCDDTLAWWLSDEVLNPPPAPPRAPKPDLTMADLPLACQAVLTE
jgi:penicillin-insensitive murein endopeptidase